jgi:hypothetical protein
MIGGSEMLSRHAAERLLSRFPATERATYAARAEREAARYPYGRTAVKLGTVTQRGTAWGEASNGDVVVAIVEDGEVSTIAYRRSSQPWNRAALRCDRLAIAED